MRVSIIIPARNEAQNIRKLLSEISIENHEIIVIDGNSNDDTYSNAKNHPSNPIVLKQKSRGKGSALSLGFQASSGDVVIAIDADGSNNPNEIEKLLAEIKGGADLVKGSRNLLNGGSEDLTKFRNFGNFFLTKTANILYSTKWTDIAYGYFAIRRDLILKMNITNFDSKVGSSLSYGQGFEIESLICCRAAKLDATIVEVPSFERNRWSGASNLKSIPDGLRALFAIFREKFSNN
jgi:glycosyltransferase involved in cell wall biosynthesis